MIIRSLATAVLAVTLLTAGATSVALGDPATAAHPSKSYKAPRNAYGQPDLSGTWSNNVGAPLERPTIYGDRNVLTPDEAAKSLAMFAKMKNDMDAPVDTSAPATATKCHLDCPYGNSGFSEAMGLAMVNGQVRASLITDPTNGRLPPLTPQAKARMDLWKTLIPDTYMYGGHPPPPGMGENDNPESRTLAERCLEIFVNKDGPIYRGGGYNSNYVIGQSADTVVIVAEMIHSTRTIRLGGKHPPENVRLWEGDSIGWWDGDTLVVETTNFRPDQTDFMGSFMTHLKVTEKFTRVGPDRLLYQFHVSDPDTWTADWGGEYEFSSSKGEMYEYACAEGNYGLRGILQGQRQQDMKTAEQAAKTTGNP